MKTKIIPLIVLLTLTNWSALALDWTYSTNLFWWISTPTNIFCGTNSTDAARDSYIVIWNKLNADINLMWQRIQNTSGGTNAIAITNTVTLPAGSSAYATNTGTVGGIAYYVLGIPAGAPGTNTQTQTVFSNSVYASTAYTLTNINPLYCNGSNYIGTFSQLYKFQLQLPYTGGGMSPGSNLNEYVIISTNGGTSWMTNSLDTASPAIWTNVMVSVIGDNNTNYAGAITLWGLDHPEYYQRTNWFEGQFTRFADPVDQSDAVTLKYLQTYVANATAMSWQLTANHYVFAPNGNTNIDMAIPFSGGGYMTSFKPVGTNWVMTATNVPIGYELECSTNLAASYGWFNPPVTVTTNLYAATNAWTFTVAKADVSASYAFFRVIAYQTAATTIYPPLTLGSVAMWRSNSWPNALAAITNSPNMSFGQASSNGVPVKWFWSNSVVWVSPWMP